MSLETNLYETSSERLISSFHTELFDPDDVEAAIDRLGDTIVSELKAGGLLGR